MVDMQFGIEKPVSPMIEHVDTVDGVAIFFKMVYDEDCDEFKVVEVLKFDVETGERKD